MRNKLILRLILLGIIVYTVLSSIFILDETQQAIVTQFGKPVGEPRTEAGLNFKIPYFHKIQFFDKRYLEWEGSRNQVPTKDKKFIFVDTYARWEITNPLQFFIRLRDERSAQSRLDDILDGETRNAVASHELLDLVRSTNRDPEITEEFMEQIEYLEDISVGRANIEKIVLEKANERTSDLGVRILDFRFKRMNYVDEVRDRVYDRMISERNRIADQFRSEGQGEASKIQGNKDRDLALIQSEAFKLAEEIKGRADAEATKIYASAYNRSRQSVDFYKFIRSMESFEKALDENTTIILSSDSEFFRYLKKVD
ncbi:protease modulator HflC [Aquiflexum sp. TKW24L]|uniref:protease modulator HflC n=1 Tax=Aquiflexum sp. TKW24L TaxID=2942212 RepID=UPI0020BECBAE|nr:protease modulator HflC [Aquiflexum sp. TKW24L]MCL6258385.1 protease modulator HflC [Aquiflexum sp. TKW24L]